MSKVHLESCSAAGSKNQFFCFWRHGLGLLFVDWLSLWNTESEANPNNKQTNWGWDKAGLSTFCWCHGLVGLLRCLNTGHYCDSPIPILMGAPAFCWRGVGNTDVHAPSSSPILTPLQGTGSTTKRCAKRSTCPLLWFPVLIKVGDTKAASARFSNSSNKQPTNLTLTYLLQPT